MLENIQPYEFELANGEKLKILIEDIVIEPPRVNLTQIDVRERRIFPAEARQRAVTYSGTCKMSLGWSKNGIRQASIDFDLGPIPVMIRVSSEDILLSSSLTVWFLFSVARMQSQQVQSKGNGWEERTRVGLGRILRGERQREAHPNAFNDKTKLSLGFEA